MIRMFLPDCLRSICFLMLFHHLALVQKHSSPSSILLLIPLVGNVLALEFFHDPYPEILHPHHFFYNHNLFHDFLVSVINPVKSCTTSGHSFHQQEFILSGLTVFMAFSITTASSMVFLHTFMFSLLGFSSIVLTIFSIEYRML